MSAPAPPVMPTLPGGAPWPPVASLGAVASPGAGPAGAPPQHLGRNSLSTLLIRRIALLVAITAVLLDVAAVFAARQVWLSSLDNEVMEALRSSPMTSVPSVQQGPFAREIELQVVHGKVVMAYVFNRQMATVLTQQQVDVLMGVRADGRPHTVALANLGTYRVAAEVTPAGQRVVGVSMLTLRAQMGSLFVLELILTVAAIIAAAVIAAAVVRRTLRPLTVLADTATRVGRMRLDQGEVQLGRLSGSAVAPDTEVGRVGQAFNHMLDNVEDALVARHRSEAKVRAFVADASHELRNPLAAIRGYAELMGRDDDLPEQQALAVDRIGVESKRMSTLVEEMLMLARLDQGTAGVSVPVDLGELVVDAVTDASVTGPDHHWTFSVPDEPVQVIGDANQLHEVVANLLGNARKHTPAGTHVLTTLTHRVVAGPAAPGQASPAADQVMLTVADDGPGVAPEIAPHVFERFVRADQARTHDDEGSTGLGLAIVAAVVQAHGGHVTLDSVPGATVFTVILPGAGGGHSLES